MIAFKAGQRKADVMARTWTLPPRPGGRRWWPSDAPRSSNWCGRPASGTPARAPHCPQFSFTKEQRRVSVFYVYICDEQMGPGFIKFCSYFPYPVKVCAVNGHEWAKRQADQVADLLGLAFLVPGSITTPAIFYETGGPVVARLVSPSR